MPHYIDPTKVKVKKVEFLTHDVLRIVSERPADLSYHAGQAVDVSINKEGWEDEARPFTFVSLPEEDYIEFNIKTYPSHHGVTEQLLSLKPDDELLIGEVFGDISYKGDGIFIAGGAGITPFTAILRKLEKENKIGGNKLIFANRSRADIIMKDYFENLLGDNFINVLSEEEAEGYEHGYLNAEMIKKYSDDKLKYYYLCGPDPMMDAVMKHLDSLGVKPESIVREAF